MDTPITMFLDKFGITSFSYPELKHLNGAALK